MSFREVQQPNKCIEYELIKKDNSYIDISNMILLIIIIILLIIIIMLKACELLVAN